MNIKYASRRMDAKPIAHSYIRFSSKRQEQGDSLRRQTSLGEKWAEKEQVKFSSLVLRDLGVSAFRGKNKHVGALAEFLRLAREGNEVLPGDFLVIEQVDRLSRQTAYQALPVVSELVDLGVRIVDLDCGGRVQIIDRDYLTSNQFALVELVLKFARAHEESQTKSKRVRAAREEAMDQLKLKGKKIAQRLPAWVKWNADRSGYLLCPTRAAAMRRVVKMAMEGLGAMSIAARLNAANVPPISDRANTTNWEYSTIQFYLRSRILVGEYQPTEAKAGQRRQSVGEPIANYYPAILTDAEFYALQAVLDSRAKGKRQGREGKNVANLFGKLLTNGYDNGTMTLCQKRAENVNLVSMQKQRGLSQTVSFPYRAFEAAFLRWVAEIEIKNNRKTGSSKLDERLGKLAAIENKIITVNAKLRDADGAAFERMVDLLAHLSAEEKAAKAEVEEIKASEAAPVVSTAEVVSIVQQLHNAKGEELTALRSRLRLAISTVVKRIDLFPVTGSWSHVRHAGCVVELRNGLVRSYQLRYERGRQPMSMTFCPPEAAKADADGLRKAMGESAKREAQAPYDVLAQLPGVFGGELAWG